MEPWFSITLHCLIKTPRLIKPPPFLRENFQILKTCLIKPPPFVPKNIVLITTFFQVFLVDGTLWNVFLPMHWSHWFSHTMNFSLNSNPTVTTRWRWGSQTRARRRKWSAQCFARASKEKAKDEESWHHFHGANR